MSRLPTCEQITGPNLNLDALVTRLKQIHEPDHLSRGNGRNERKPILTKINLETLFLSVARAVFSFTQLSSRTLHNVLAASS
jgi:hypothetical protein